MTKVTKTGFGFWKQTVVEHNGRTDVYSGSAEVEKKGNSVCVTEKGLFSENSTCYLESSGNSNSGAVLPDGKLVGASKSIAIESTNGERKEYNSGFFSVNSMEKHGNQVQVVQNGIFGKKVIDTFDAKDVGKIESEDCNVCKSTNP